MMGQLSLLTDWPPRKIHHFRLSTRAAAGHRQQDRRRKPHAEGCNGDLLTTSHLWHFPQRSPNSFAVFDLARPYALSPPNLTIVTALCEKGRGSSRREQTVSKSPSGRRSKAWMPTNG